MSGNRPPLVYMEAAFGIAPLTRPEEADWVRLALAPSFTDLIWDGDDLEWDGDPLIDIESALSSLKSLSTSRGARIKTGEFETGEATAVIDDRFGWLDPSNTASPYAPDVLPRTRVRFVVSHDGGEDVIWTGFIKRLPISWRSAVAFTTVGAAGLLWLLASGPDLPPSVLEYETKETTPVAYWPLADVGAKADDVVGLYDGTYRYADGVTQEQLLSYDGDRQAQVYGLSVNNDGEVRFQGQHVDIAPFLPAPTAFSFAITMQPVVVEAGQSTYLVRAASESDWYASLATDGATLLFLVSDAGEGPSNTVFAAVQAEDVLDPNVARPAQIVCTYDGATARMWVNGNEVFNTTYAGYESAVVPGTGSPTTLRIGSPKTLVGTGRLLLAHHAWWDRAVSESEISTLHSAAVDAWSGDTTGERLNRILDVMGVDPDDRDIDTGTQTVGPATLGGNPAEHLRKLAATEGGPVFEDAAGRLAFREKITNDPTVTHVFSDDPDGDSGTAVEPVDPDYSLDRVINVAKVTRESGGAQVARNQDSIDRYGEISTSVDTLHATPSGARAKAAQLVIRGANPRLVFPKVIANHIDTDAAVLTDTEIADAVTVIARPPRGGDPIEQTSIVERIEHRFGKGWKTEFGVVEHLVLPTFYWDEPGQGWDESVWAPL